MSDALSSIGSSAVSTIGTVAVVGATAKVVGKAVGGMNRSGGHSKHSKNYNVWNHGKGSGKKSKSMLGF